MRGKDGDVADEGDAQLQRAGAHFAPLPVEEKLQRPHLVGLPAQFRAGLLQGCLTPAADFLRPLMPRQPAMPDLQGDEDGVIVEPGGLALAEGFEGAPDQGAARALFEEAASRCLEQVVARVLHLGEKHLLLREVRQPGNLARSQHAVHDEGVEGNEQGIAGKTGQALVGRGAVARGAERQHLPEPLPHAGQFLEPAQSLRPDLADAVPAGQGGGMQEDAAGAWDGKHGG